MRSYTEAIQQSLKVRWVVDTCPQGEQCWCRTVKCETPLMYKDGESDEEFYVIRAGEVGKDIVEHIVNLQNKSLQQ